MRTYGYKAISSVGRRPLTDLKRLGHEGSMAGMHHMRVSEQLQHQIAAGGASALLATGAQAGSGLGPAARSGGPMSGAGAAAGAASGPAAMGGVGGGATSVNAVSEQLPFSLRNPATWPAVTAEDTTVPVLALAFSFTSKGGC